MAMLLIRCCASILLAFAVQAAIAQTQAQTSQPAVTPVDAQGAVIEKPTASLKVHIPEGTEVPLVFVDSVSSASNVEGDRFTLRVDENVKVGGQIAIKAGSIAVGTVSNAHKRGFMGKAGELNVTIDHVSVGDDRIHLRASKGKQGDSKVGATVALTILFGPLGLLKRGHDIDIKPGTPITAFVDQATDVEVQPSR